MTEEVLIRTEEDFSGKNSMKRRKKGYTGLL